MILPFIWFERKWKHFRKGFASKFKSWQCTKCGRFRFFEKIEASHDLYITNVKDQILLPNFVSFFISTLTSDLLSTSAGGEGLGGGGLTKWTFRSQADYDWILNITSGVDLGMVIYGVLLATLVVLERQPHKRQILQRWLLWQNILRNQIPLLPKESVKNSSN